MKQFNLKEYLANPSRRVVTRDGRNARIICTDRKDLDFPIIALIENISGKGEKAYSYTKEGWNYDYCSDNLELFFAPKKHEGWINIYRSDTLGYYIRQNKLYNSKEEADEVAKLNDRTFIKTLKIEWED